MSEKKALNPSANRAGWSAATPGIRFRKESDKPPLILRADSRTRGVTVAKSRLHLEPLARSHAPSQAQRTSPTRGWAPTRQSQNPLIPGLEGGGRVYFAVCIYHPPLGLTGRMWRREKRLHPQNELILTLGPARPPARARASVRGVRTLRCEWNRKQSKFV